MSDLAGRASNGGARTGGPVPVPSGSSSGAIRPPTEIMRARNAREARRQEEQKAEEQRRMQERRQTAERRSAAMGGAAPRYSQSSSVYTPETQQPQQFERTGSGRVAGSAALGDPIGRTTQDYSTRPRGPSVSQQEEPRAVPASSGATRRAQATQSSRQPAASSIPSAAQPQPPQSDTSAARGGASSFPHAFQRWETLSSHWEGLTSYWIRKLEQNTQEIQDTVPNAVTLNRQITDLSAAGANLFHAVVELQRLRASSERKFQRWFFETRAEGEKTKEVHAQIDNQLKLERNAREEAARQRAEAAIQAENAKRETAEMRRELMIAKDEARRAWEELGRRNLESLDAAQSLKEGKVTLIHGVSVVPYASGPSRTGSLSQRPTTRDGPPYYGSTGMGSAGGFQSPGDEAAYYQQEASPTNTDPFMESTPTASRYEGGSYQQPYQTSGTPGTSSTAQTAIPVSSQRPATARQPVSSQEAQRFYQQPQETFLHSPQSAQQAAGGGAAAGPSVPLSRPEIQSEASYVETVSEGDTEYALDTGGNIARDESGHPVYIRQRTKTDDTDDTYDTEADVLHEQELAEQYGSGMLPEAPSVPATSAQAMATYTPTAATTAEQSLRPDYEGRGYEGYDIPTRHHHPTRLSDVLEEEEERSSRRTGE